MFPILLLPLLFLLPLLLHHNHLSCSRGDREALLLCCPELNCIPSTIELKAHTCIKEGHLFKYVCTQEGSHSTSIQHKSGRNCSRHYQVCAKTKSRAEQRTEEKVLILIYILLFLVCWRNGTSSEQQRSCVCRYARKYLN